MVDLGEYWEEKLQVPIPLGGIITNRKNNSICSSSLVIDKKFLEKKGSTKIYISSKITT